MIFLRRPTRALATLLLALALSVALFLHVRGRENPKPIRVGIYQLNPFCFTDQRGQARGLYPDLITRIANDEDWRVTFVPGSWTEGLARLQREEIDLLTAIAVSPERHQVMDFNHESVFDEWGQVFLQPGHAINTISGLEGMRVAVMDQDICGINFIKTTKLLGITCKIITLPSHAHVFEALQKGVVSAGVSTQHFGLTHAREFGLVASPIQFSPFSIYFAAKKGRMGDILRRIDTTLSRWKQDPASYYHHRLAYWMGAKEYEKAIIPRWVIVAVTAIALVSALLAYFNRALNSTVKKRTRELRGREKEYRELVESANSIILRMDKYGKVLFINQFGLDLFGYTKEELTGRDVVGTILSPEEAQAHRFKISDTGIFELPDNSRLIENENRCKDGRTVFIQWSNRTITDEKGRFHEILSIGTDITQRRQLELSLHQTQKMEAIGTLAGGIAHDFNNILAIMIGYTELALLSVDNPTKVQEALEQVARGGRRAKDLVAQIFTFSRKSESEKKPLQPSLIVNEAIKLLRPSLPSTIAIEKTLASCGRILADPTQVHQILMNLCTNAYHAMEQTGGTLSIALSDLRIESTASGSPQFPHHPGDYILLEVRDTGNGIDPVIVPRIFDPYFTTKASGKGTGLGLSVVHGIVKEHRGHIAVRNVPGEGTAFLIAFPILPEATEPPSTAIADERVTGGHETILVVDDEQEIAATIDEMLSRHGYAVRAFSDVLSALASFRQAPDAFDLVVTDMTMPGITGFELAREVLARRPKLPVILCTGYSEPATIEASRDIGISTCLQKPVMMATLLQTVRALLDGRGTETTDPCPQASSPRAARG